MSKSNFKLFCQRCALSVCSILLLACSSSDNNTATTVFQPKLFRDFPTPFGTFANINNVVTTVGIATTGTGDGLTVYGQARWDSSSAEIDQFEFSINDSTTPFYTEAPVSNPYSWQQILTSSEPLEIGINSFNMLAKFNGFSFFDLFFVTRGTSWMREVAIQYDANSGRDRWLVLDMARRALLEVDLNDGSKTIISSLATGMGTGNALVEPVDFVIDGDRALVVDRGAAAIIAIDLTVGTSAGNRTVFADTSITPLPFDEPAAVAIDVVGERLFIADIGLQNIVEIKLDTANEGVRSLLPAAANSDPTTIAATKAPIDLAFHFDTNSLYVSDAAVNGVVAIDLTSGDRRVFVSSDESAQEVGYAAIRNTAIAGDTLYVTDGGQRIIAVDLTLGAANGLRTVLSGVTDLQAVVPSTGLNLLRSPEALAVDTAAVPNRLLVIDNLYGVLVAVGLADDADGNSTGHRIFLDGGATVGVSATNNEANSDGGVSGTNREAQVLGSSLGNPVDMLAGSGVILTLDRFNNRVININALSGARTAVVQHIDSVAETNLVDPTTFQLSVNGNYYIVDAATNRVIQMPINSGVRTVTSDEASAVPFVDPVDSVIVESVIDGALDESVLYVLDAGLNDIVKVDLVDKSRILMGLSCAPNPIAMLRNKDEANGVDELLIMNRAPNELYAVDLLTDTCAVTAVANYGVAVDAVDISLDSRATDPANYDVLILDAAANAIVPVRVGANGRGMVAVPYAPLHNNADEFILPVAMGFDQVNQRAYVLDAAIRSVFAIDLRWRTTSAGTSGHERVGVDLDFKIFNSSKDRFCREIPINSGTTICDDVVVDAQRVIISRGTALNCDANVVGIDACNR